MQRPTLSEIAAFCAVAKTRSFRRAADELGVTPSTLSHTISGLEAQLGVRLFHRTTRSVATTEAGENFRQRMEPLIKDFDLALQETRRFGETVGGSIRISAASPAIRPLFEQVLPELCEKYPEIQVEFVADGRLLDIVDEGFDAGIRFGDVVPKDMVGVPFGPPSRFVAVASPAYLQRHGMPGVPGDLLHHRCIRMRLTSGRILPWAFAKDGVAQTLDPSDGLTLNDVSLQLDAASKGLGIAYVWEDAARALLDTGTVQVVLAEWAPPASRLLLYFPSNRRIPPALSAFIQVLRANGRISTAHEKPGD